MDTVPVTLRLPKRLHAQLKRLARQEAIRRDRDTSMADLVRETLVERFQELEIREEQKPQ